MQGWVGGMGWWAGGGTARAAVRGAGDRWLIERSVWLLGLSKAETTAGGAVSVIRISSTDIGPPHILRLLIGIILFI